MSEISTVLEKDLNRSGLNGVMDIGDAIPIHDFQEACL